MRRTSTLPAAGAALGLLAGFVMAPAGPAPLDRDVTPYAVTVAWRTGGPTQLPSVAGVEVDDWGGRFAPAPPAERRAAERRATTPRAKARVPERRARAPQAKAAPAPRPAIRAEAAPGQRVVRGAELAAATFGTVERACPREAAAVREAERTRPEAEARVVVRTRQS
jgi:hypothetical protein